MPLTSLAPVLQAADSADGYAVGLVCLGYEEAALYVELGAELGVPIILQAGPGARRAIPIEIWGRIFSSLAEQSDYPVVAHLDHGTSEEECRAALDAGFSSVMFDGSQLPFSENMERSFRVANLAKRYHASVEVEVGHVGYDGDPQGKMTDPEELARISGSIPDATIAISVGNIHLQTEAKAKIDWARVKACREDVKSTFAMHGGSGVHHKDRLRLAQEFGVRKINIGTELRQVAGAGMRNYFTDGAFDKLAALQASVDAMRPVAKKLLSDAWQV